MANDLKFIRKVVRGLKKRFGLRVELFQPTTNTTDLETGVITRADTSVVVRRCIVLNSEEARDFVYALSFIAANKDFTYGGFFDVNQRLLIVDAKDLGAHVPNNDGWAVFNGYKYKIVDAERSEDNRGWYILVEGITTQPVTP